VLFLAQDGVSFDRAYVVKLPLSPSYQPQALAALARTTLRFENKAAKGLGKALPAGAVAVRQPQPDRPGAELFVGAAALRDVPAGEAFELELGAASDIQVGARTTSAQRFRRTGHDGLRVSYEVTLTNAKGETAPAEVRVMTGGQRGFAVISESAPHATKAGDPVWKLALPANERTVLTYGVEYLLN
jgi:hypothetical protein